MNKLTPTQKEMLSFIAEKGFIMPDNIRLFYSTQEAGRNALNRLICFGFLKEDTTIFGKFDWTGKKTK